MIRHNDDLNDDDSVMVGEVRRKAEQIVTVQRAIKDTLGALNESSPTDKVLANKMLDLFNAVVDGRAREDVVSQEFEPELQRN
ncbi:MAG: hypothetical protein LBL38_03765 [Lactobacillales bacterium]|jgi:hypothetical protein|nr:hypothetical protein [Lactobacillales bacterium]MDR1253987.1 hypothetical protein [Oscillospiraceae bacterium]